MEGLLRIMKGILEKVNDVWNVRWSDLHSFTHGTHWMWTPLHASQNIELTNLKEGDDVEFDIITNRYDEINFTPINYAKLRQIPEPPKPPLSRLIKETKQSRGCCPECGEGYDNDEEWMYNTECELCGHPIPENLIIKRNI